MPNDPCPCGSGKKYKKYPARWLVPLRERGYESKDVDTNLKSVHNGIGFQYGREAMRMYLHRAIEKTILKAEHQTKAVLITGARQVGKSTTIRELYPDYTYITLDDENYAGLARTDSTLFFRDIKYPVIIDEAQYAPELFRAIKRIADADNTKGRFFLTGSQSYELLSSASESLAGRISIVEMGGLSLRELFHINFTRPFVPDDSYIQERGEYIKPYPEIWSVIHRGSMPELLDPDRDWEWFYRDYVRTYLERDIRRIINIKDEIKFRNFLTCLAARSGELLVYQELANEVGIDIKTAQSWVSVIAASGLIRILHTYQNNIIKRAIKTPKLFFMDTGLLCYLTGWSNANVLRNGAMSGNIFETFVVSEILKSYGNAGSGTDGIYYYRDKDKKEIDLLIEKGNMIYPVEIKKSGSISKDWIKNFGVLDKISGKQVGRGAVICLAEKRLPINDKVDALPIEYI